MDMTFNRIFLVIIDSAGIGASPDAAAYNDSGADTLGHIALSINGLHMPNMARLGLGNIRKIQGIDKTDKPLAYYTKMQEASVGKDTITGHWEMMGLHIETPFHTFPNGFPDRLIQQLEQFSNRQVIGNKPASGTLILDELGERQIKTGELIVYTSADSVLQIAAHEEVIPLEELYRICEYARRLANAPEYRIGRVIARPYLGFPGAFKRTSNRHDYALKPFKRTVMNKLKDSGFEVIALGKIADIFDGEGITKTTRTVSNMDGIDKLLNTMDQDFNGLCFLNLVDFDALYGHRRDPGGYGKALKEFDGRLPNIFEKLRPRDLIIFSADHGNDPTHHGTDHTREYVPLIVHHKGIQVGKELPLRNSFADIGASIAENFSVQPPEHGESFLKEILKYEGSHL